MDAISKDERNELFDLQTAEARPTQPNLVKREEQAPFELGSLKFWAVGDRVLVEEDEFKSGYECDTCSATGRAPCTNCDGTGKTMGKFTCAHCQGAGKVLCGDCSGKGGLLITPETSERRPSSGRIVSVGPDCRTLKLGDGVLYSNFAGYAVNLKRTGNDVCIRILHEPEILARMDGHLTLSNLKGKSDVALPSK